MAVHSFQDFGLLNNRSLFLSVLGLFSPVSDPKLPEVFLHLVLPPLPRSSRLPPSLRLLAVSLLHTPAGIPAIATSGFVFRLICWLSHTCRTAPGWCEFAIVPLHRQGRKCVSESFFPTHLGRIRLWPSVPTSHCHT